MGNEYHVGADRGEIHPMSLHNTYALCMDGFNSYRAFRLALRTSFLTLQNVGGMHGFWMY